MKSRGRRRRRRRPTLILFPPSFLFYSCAVRRRQMKARPSPPLFPLSRRRRSVLLREKERRIQEIAWNKKGNNQKHKTQVIYERELIPYMSKIPNVLSDEKRGTSWRPILRRRRLRQEREIQKLHNGKTSAFPNRKRKRKKRHQFPVLPLLAPFAPPRS